METRLALIGAGTLLLCFGGLLGTCSYMKQLDAHAQVVETCVKHPVTRMPFKNSDP